MVHFKEIKLDMLMCCFQVPMYNLIELLLLEFNHFVKYVKSAVWHYILVLFSEINEFQRNVRCVLKFTKIHQKK